MDLEEIIIDTSDQPDSSVLIIYTGGTMGMGQNKSGVLVSFNFQEILDRIPSLKTMNLHLTVISFSEPLDSLNIKPVHWVHIAQIIDDNYKKYDDRDLVILNVSQCDGGKVSQEEYDTGKALYEIGILSGKDITTESAITKMMVVLGFEINTKEKLRLLIAPMCGEME